jgi:hypothetical protein
LRVYEDEVEGEGSIKGEVDAQTKAKAEGKVKGD